MADERRGGRRAPISGVRVTYEGATGAQIEAEVLDLATGGLFIRTEAPLSTGKRIALDLHILGEPGPWSALGRVVWSRPAAEPGRPAGMGVKLIDVDDATIDLIARLVETREPTAPGVGKVAPVTTAPIVSLGAAAPERERTLMGVGGSGAEPESPPGARGVTPTAGAPPPPTVTAISPEPAGIAVARAEVEVEPEAAMKPPPEVPAPQREHSLAIDLVTARKDVVAPPPEPAPERAAVTVPPRGDPGGGTARWVVVVLLLLVAGIAAYVLFDGFLKPMGR
jgi:uncharacterized protein (TIGR02266 family)